jgi:hypothetical protein
MGRNYRVTVRRICAVVGVVMVFAWGIPALAPAPAALASPVVASAATRSTPPQAHPRDAQVPLDAPLCLKLLEANEYIITSKMTLGCNAGAQTYPGPPHISLAIALGVCSGLLLWAGVDHATTTVACLAANPLAFLSNTQWCGPNDCLNAWGGGPWVDAFTGGPETGDTHQDFTVIDENGDQNTAEIMYTGSGSWSGECIGDAYNNSGYADTSLDPCGLPGQNAGWGTQMTWGTSGCPSGEAWFHDNHWNGYLAPANTGGNGRNFYLNDQSKVCFALVTNT